MLPNRHNLQRLGNLKIVREEMKKISQRDQLAIVMTYDSFRGAELHCAICFVKVTTKVPQNLLFCLNETQSEAYHSATRVAKSPEEEEKMDIPEFFGGNFRTDNPDTISAVCAGLVDVHDDNDPVSEDISNIETNMNGYVQFEKEWDHGGGCFRKLLGATNHPARLCNHEWHLQITELHISEILFPIKWIN